MPHPITCACACLKSALASLSQQEKPPQQQQQTAQQQRPEGAAAAGGGPQEQQGFDNPAGGAAAAAGPAATAAAPVKDLGVVGRGTKRLNLAPVQVLGYRAAALPHYGIEVWASCVGLCCAYAVPALFNGCPGAVSATSQQQWEVLPVHAA